MIINLAPEAQVQIITQAGVIITLIVTYWMNRRKSNQVADKVEEVKAVAAGQATAVGVLQETADATHKIVNSRYDEIREELKKSNENNATLTRLLAKAGIIANGVDASEVMAAPNPPSKKGK